MCGICGVLTFDDAPMRTKMLAAMCGTIHHRGPDEHGYYVGGCVGLTMRWLSTIDLSSGQQPIWNETGDICIM